METGRSTQHEVIGEIEEEEEWSETKWSEVRWEYEVRRCMKRSEVWILSLLNTIVVDKSWSMYISD
jgi:hypothetical protein